MLYLVFVYFGQKRKLDYCFHGAKFFQTNCLFEMIICLDLAVRKKPPYSDAANLLPHIQQKRGKSVVMIFLMKQETYRAPQI